MAEIANSVILGLLNKWTNGQVVSLNVSNVTAIFPTQTLLQLIGQDGQTMVLEGRVYNGHGLIEIWAAGGTAAAPTALTTDFHISSFAGGGYDGTGFIAEASANMQYFAAENWTASAHGTYILFQTVKKGTTTLRGVVRVNDDASLGILGNLVVGQLTGGNVSAYASPITVSTVLGGTGAGSRAVLELAAGSGNTANTVGQIDFTKTDTSTAILAQIFTGFSGAGGKMHFRTRTTGGVLTDWVQLDQNGNLILAVGGKLVVTTGTNASAGTATLVAGTVTVNTTAVTANSIIMFSYKTPGGTLGFLQQGTIVAATSFVINSLLSTTVLNTGDTSVVNWWIIN